MIKEIIIQVFKQNIKDILNANNENECWTILENGKIILTENNEKIKSIPVAVENLKDDLEKIDKKIEAHREDLKVVNENVKQKEQDYKEIKDSAFEKVLEYESILKNFFTILSS